jgi:single-stranded-DNA-specific exonuclease
MEPDWLIQTQSNEDKRVLSQELGVSPVFAHLLLNRGIRTPEEGRVFLRPKLADLHDPYMFPDMEKAVRRIKDALLAGEKILVFGDYDVDGITATALLYHFFNLMGTTVTCFIPHRIKEGYSLNAEAINEAKAQGVSLIITVDCGITNVEEIEQTRALGIDVIVTDHHEAGSRLPAAFAIINPKLPGSRYPFRDLAGVGVAFKLAWAVANALSAAKKVPDEVRDFLLNSLAFVALGTVADVVPLLGENRVLAKFGLKYLEESANPGVRALIDISGTGDQPLSARDIAFKMGPRLNAAGRMGKSHLGIELMTTSSMLRASEIAKELDLENQKRQEVEHVILEETYRMLGENPSWASDRALVLSSDHWHPGVIGIVASRLVEEFHKPVILIAIDEGRGKGSARSIDELPLYEVLAECKSALITYGGHAHAAGLEVAPDRLDEFRDMFIERVGERLKGADMKPKLNVDMETLLSALSRPVLKELEILRPHGEKNPSPLFATFGVQTVGKPRVVGKDGRHLSLFIRQGETTLKGIAFDMADALPKVEKSGGSCNIVYKPFLNDWQGQESVELEIKDFSFE